MKIFLMIVLFASTSVAQTKFPVIRGSTVIQSHEDSTGKYRVVYQYGTAPSGTTFTMDTLGKRMEPTGADATVIVLKRQSDETWKKVGTSKTLKREHPVETIERAKKE